MILVDTLRADRVSWYERGTTEPPLTPFLRTLAEHGTVFWNAYAQSSWTVPSVASLFTSRYPSQHHTNEFGSILPAEEQTMAEAFKAHGYATAGFSANYIGVRREGYGKGFDTFNLVLPADPGARKARAEQINAAGLAWLDGLPAGAAAPVFLYLHYMEPHIPYHPPSSVLQRIVGQRGPVAERMRGVERAQRMIEESFAAANADAPHLVLRKPIDDETLSGLQDLYDAEVASVDAQLAELFAQLQSRGWLANSLIVITADHGDEFKEHGQLGHGQTLYNEVLHVPLLVVAPQQTERLDVRNTVSLIDVAPTLLDYCGIPRPDPFEGRSLRGVIEHGHGWRRWLTTARQLAGERETPIRSYSELFPYYERQRHDPQIHRRSIIADTHKVIARADDSTAAYDLAADPGEHTAETDPAAAPADVRESLNRFAERMARSGPAPPVAPLDEKARERLHALGYAQ